jgi:hypothetical protein
MADALVDVAPDALREAWDAAGRLGKPGESFIHEMVTLEEFHESLEWMVTHGKSTDDLFWRPNGPLHHLCPPKKGEGRRPAHQVWRPWKLIKLMSRVRSDPLCQAYMELVREGQTVPVRDWALAHARKAQDTVVDLMESDDDAIAYRAADSILKRAESAEGTGGHADGPSETSRQSAAVVQVLVASLESRGESEGPEDRADGRPVVDLEPTVGSVEGSGSPALPAEPETLGDSP